MSTPSDDFNPFVDDTDAIEDSVVNDRPDFVERPVDEDYLPDAHPKPTREELEEELPPETAYDFEKELSKIMEDMQAVDSPLPLLSPPADSATPPPALSIEQPLESEEDFPAEEEDLLAAFDFDLDETELAPTTLSETELLPTDLSEGGHAAPAEEDDWGFSSPADEATTVAAEEDDWGFIPPTNETPAAAKEESDEISFPGFDFAEVERDIALQEREVEGVGDELAALLEPADAPAVPSLEEQTPEWDEPEETDEPSLEEPAVFEGVATPPATPESTKKEKKAKKEKAPKVKKEKKKRFDFSQTLANIKSELKGGDEVNGTPASSLGPSSKKAPPKNVLTGETQLDRKEKTEAPTSEKAKGLARKVLSPYSKLAGLVLTALMKILGLLAKLPAIGKPLGSLQSKESGLRVVAHVVPLAILIVGLTLHGNTKYGPETSTITFPDGGAAAFSAFSYDKSASSATGKIENTGEVVAKVTPVFTVYAIAPGLNPLSFFYPQKVGVCRGAEQNVDIGATKAVEIACDANIGGFRKKVSGELEW